MKSQFTTELYKSIGRSTNVWLKYLSKFNGYSSNQLSIDFPHRKFYVCTNLRIVHPRVIHSRIHSYTLKKKRGSKIYEVIIILTFCFLYRKFIFKLNLQLKVCLNMVLLIIAINDLKKFTHSSFHSMSKDWKMIQFFSLHSVFFIIVTMTKMC